MDTHKSGCGFPLHRCHRCCTCLVTPPPTHHFSTLIGPTGMQKVRERAFLPKTIIFESWTRMSPCAGWLAIKTSSTEGAVPRQRMLASCSGPQARCKQPWPSQGSFPKSWPLTGISNIQTVTVTRSPGDGHKWGVLYCPAHTGINPAFIKPHLAGVSIYSFSLKTYSKDMPMKQTIW